MKVEVAYAPSVDQQIVISVEVESGFSVRQVIERSGILDLFPSIPKAIGFSARRREVERASLPNKYISTRDERQPRHCEEARRADAAKSRKFKCEGYIDLSKQAVGIWGTLCSLETTVRPNDRVEIYRPLCQDPKILRKERAKQFLKKKCSIGRS